MPCINDIQEHRQKIDDASGVPSFGRIFNAMVARSVGRKKTMEDPEAKASMRKGSDNMIKESMISQW